MDTCQDAISKTFLQSVDGERLFAEDLEDAEAYRDRFLELPTKIGLKMQNFALSKAANYSKSIDQFQEDLNGIYFPKYEFEID
ncbi:hypothetical protein TNCV_3369081 [Trichonephila clavipes]|uniref:Uncharacterized protein n=1 Tax=Trichonephila clavipes TaxID=2585209 RepID=A0A8X6R2S6_TRICX|nr:hypothetical protein TNCV_3369081 [Trichonephila clavipes]